MLHNDREKFVQLVTAVSDHTGIDKALIEKDYFVTLFLSRLRVREPLLVFKGDTCLSKCFKLIKRFSEDIDINLEGVGLLTQSRKKLVKKHIIGTIDELDLALSNPEQVNSGMDHNTYRISYPAAFVNASLKQHMEVEPFFIIEAFPTVEMSASSLIYDYLKEKALDAIVSEYGLEPFDIRVQTLERTFVDKVFAVCDYHLNEKTNAQSRHLYDIHKILPHMTLDGGLRSFVEDVRKVREGKRDCPSADKEVSLPGTIERIIAEKTYKNDYDAVTALLLYETVSYDETVRSMRTIADWLKQR